MRTPLAYPASAHVAFPTGYASPWGFPSFQVSGMNLGVLLATSPNSLREQCIAPLNGAQSGECALLSRFLVFIADFPPLSQVAQFQEILDKSVFYTHGLIRSWLQ